MNLVGLVQLLTTLAPLVRGAVGMAESVIGPGRGTEKLKLATDAVEASLPQISAVAGDLERARALIGPLIEGTVAAANAGSKKPAAKRRRRR